MKNILVPTDFSKEAKKALLIALEIVKKTNGKIILLHILEIPNYLIENTNYNVHTGILNDLQEELISEEKKEFDKLVKDENIDTNFIDFKREIGSAKRKIVEFANDTNNNIDLIVMGTSGISSVEAAVVGSNTENVVRTVNCPVISTKTAFKTFNNFVLASNFINIDSTPNYEKVLQFAKLFDAKIHLVHINTPSQFINSNVLEKNIQSFVEYWKLDNYTINQYNHEEFETGLFLFSKKVSGDLIAMGTHGHIGLNRILYESKTESVVNNFRIPILSFKL